MLTLRRLALLLLDVLREGGHVGLKAACKRELVRVALERKVAERWPEERVPDAQMRVAKEYLLEHKTLVCSCQMGYFLPANREEANDYALKVYVRLQADAKHKVKCVGRGILKQFGPKLSKGAKPVIGIQQEIWRDFHGEDLPWMEARA